MVKLAGTFSHFKPFTVLVVGDFLFDTYTIGKVKRISPEAPVPIMEVTSQESRPGGAGNVVLNLTTLGGHVFAVGRIGADLEGEELKRRLNLEGADSSALLVEPGYRTPVKNRLVADSQQLLRVDLEKVTPLPLALENLAIEHLQILIPKSQIVAISDYGKGFLSARLIGTIIDLSRENGIPVIVDPKGSDFTKYRRATVLKPNLSEAYAAAKMPLSTPLETVAHHLLDLSQVDKLLITRSEAGISLFEKEGGRKDFPVRSKEVKDVTGAGDTVLSLLCLSLANGLEIDQAAQLANIGAGLSIERLGCVQVTLPELAQRLLEFDSHMKIFEESHTYALHHLLKDKSYSLLVLQNGQSITNALFRIIRELSGKSSHQLMIYINDPEPKEEFIHLLSSLNAVDTIILQSESLKNLCSAIHPHKIYLLKGEAVSELDQAKDLLAALLEQTSSKEPVSKATALEH